MKLHIRGYRPLIIPQEAIVPMKGQFDGDTPYVAKVVARCKERSYIAGKLPVKILCLEYLRDYMDESYRSYSDPMAGIGISALIFGRHLGNVMQLNDFDASCRMVLRANFKVYIDNDDVMKKTRFTPAGLIFMDFNELTFKRAQEKYDLVLKRVFEAAEKYVVINDCSLFYLRYGATAFENYSKLLGRKITSVEEYLTEVGVWYFEKFGWHLTRVAYFKETAFLLFSAQKHGRAAGLRSFTYGDVPENMVTVE